MKLTLSDVQKAVKTVWPLFEMVGSGGLYPIFSSYGDVEFHICSAPSRAPLIAIADMLDSVEADYSTGHDINGRWTVMGKFHGVTVRVCLDADDWPKTELAKAAERIRNCIANGDQPDPSDEDLFAICPECKLDRLGSECGAGCVLGRVLPPETTKATV